MPAMSITTSQTTTIAQDDHTHLTTLNFDHLRRMLTDIGIWQHTAGDDPNPRHGYSIDDEARGLVVGLRYWQQGVETKFNSLMSTICFRFIEAAALKDGECIGRYHNFCDSDGTWLDSIGSADSFGRTLWGLGVAYEVDAPFVPRSRVEPLLRRSLPCMDDLPFVRSQAFTLMGLAYSRFDDVHLRKLADSLCDAYEKTASADWQWFEDGMTYCNARIPQSLLLAALAMPENERWAQIGAESLEFLLKVTHHGKNGYAPVGNKHLTHRAWFQRGERRPPLFDQQPVDAGALAEACVDAYRVTQDPKFRLAASEAFGWYFGLNVHGVPVYNPENGSVGDAITRYGISRNSGAESVLSIHLAHQAMQSLDDASR